MKIHVRQRFRMISSLAALGLAVLTAGSAQAEDEVLLARVDPALCTPTGFAAFNTFAQTFHFDEDTTLTALDAYLVRPPGKTYTVNLKVYRQVGPVWVELASKTYSNTTASTFHWTLGTAISLDAGGVYKLAVNTTASAAQFYQCAPTSYANGNLIRGLNDDRPFDMAFALYGYVPDELPPTVILGALPTYINSTQYTVSGNVTDNSGSVSSIRYYVNGAQVASGAPGAYGPVSALLSFAEGANSVQIKATDAAGNLGVSSVGSIFRDTVAPSLSFTDLTPLVGSSSMLLEGQVSDPGGSGIAGASLMLNGQALTTLPDGAFSLPISLVEGTNGLTLTAIDRAGNQNTVTGYVVSDTLGPQLTVDSFPGLTNVASLAISGYATDAHAITSLQIMHTFNGGANTQSVPTGNLSDVTFSQLPLTLAEGLNLVTVVATDELGNATTVTREITLDSIPPLAVLPVMPAYTNLLSHNITLTASDSGSGVDAVSLVLTAPLSGEYDLSVTELGEGLWSALVDLEEDGLYTLTLTVTDLAGNESATQVEFILDTVLPVVSILSPLNDQAFGVSEVSMTVEVSDASPTAVNFGSLVNDLPAGGGITSTTLILPAEGTNWITVEVTDAAGNKASSQVYVDLDFSAPVAEVDLQDNLQLGPMVDHLLPLTLTVDDLTATTITASWDASLLLTLADEGGVLQLAAPLTEGLNVLVLTITDEVGHVTTITRTVTYDITPPEGTFAPELSTPQRGTIDLAIDATDNLTGVASVTFAFDGALLTAQATEGRWTIDLDTTLFADGVYPVTAILVDGVGNTSSVALELMIDNTPPDVLVVSPELGDYVHLTIQVAGQASDATSGVASLELKLGGTSLGVCNSTTCAFAFDTTTLADGPFVVTAIARDVAGNESTDEITAISDNTKPEKFLVSPVTGQVVAGSVDVAVDVTAEVYFYSVECKVDGVSLGVSYDPLFSATVPLMNTMDGAVTVSCEAIDLAGNVGIESASVTLNNWTELLNPRSLNLKSKGGENSVTLYMEGSNISLLLPASTKQLALLVPGGSPVPMTGSGPSTTGDYDADGIKDVTLKFDRQLLINSIKAGISSGAINPALPVEVTILSGSRRIGYDQIKVIQ